MVSERIQRIAATAVRVSEAEREQTIAVLREQCVAGRLSLDELSSRVRAAYEARTRAELHVTVEDLPGTEPTPIPVAAPARQVIRTALQRAATRWTVALLGSEVRKGRWRIEEQTASIAIMGSCTLDLREVALDTPEVSISAVALMGTVDIIVPEGVEVEMGGLAVMGSREVRTNDAAIYPGAPVVRVQAYALMGSVSVKSKPGRVLAV